MASQPITRRIGTAAQRPANIAPPRDRDWREREARVERESARANARAAAARPDPKFAQEYAEAQSAPADYERRAGIVSAERRGIQREMVKTAREAGLLKARRTAAPAGGGITPSAAVAPAPAQAPAAAPAQNAPAGGIIPNPMRNGDAKRGLDALGRARAAEGRRLAGAAAQAYGELGGGGIVRGYAPGLRRGLEIQRNAMDAAQARWRGGIVPTQLERVEGIRANALVDAERIRQSGGIGQEMLRQRGGIGQERLRQEGAAGAEAIRQGGGIVAGGIAAANANGGLNQWPVTLGGYHFDRNTNKWFDESGGEAKPADAAKLNAQANKLASFNRNRSDPRFIQNLNAYIAQLNGKEPADPGDRLVLTYDETDGVEIWKQKHLDEFDPKKKKKPKPVEVNANSDPELFAKILSEYGGVPAEAAPVMGGGIAPRAGSGGRPSPVRVDQITEEEYNRLPTGTQVVLPDGRIVAKP